MNPNTDIDDFDPKDLIDEENVFNIDTEFINNNSLKEAEGLIDNLKDIYADPEFMKANPKFITRLKAEIEDLRILLKVRKSDEVVHDLLLGTLGKQSGNASLYRALTDVQKTILSTTTDISTKIKDINTMLKNIQLEINFPKDQDQIIEGDEPISDQSTFRGSKDFIKQMRENMENDNLENEKENE